LVEVVAGAVMVHIGHHGYPRNPTWSGRCTRPSRSSRRWWVPGTTSPRAPTISSSRD